MPACRMDLADVGSPEALVKLILQAEPDLPIPVPIEDLCRQLDIMAIQDLDTDGFEGGLITDADRSEGIILVKKGVEERRRFTIGHELGHFLMPLHIPDQAGKFLCSRADMLRLKPKEGDRRQRMEVEANRFSSLILMPPTMLRRSMSGFREPDLQHIPALARDYKVSKEAMARAYVQQHGENIAIVVVKDGVLLRNYKSFSFPFITCSPGRAVPARSLLHRGPHDRGVASDFAECVADLWVDVRRGERAPKIYEQVYVQRDGCALVLLHAETVDEEEEDEERQLEDSWRVGFKAKRR
ncbi:ImmA/IrrE family metallo-endopeptidase [Methylobacterium sp. J-030]|uniref:ImmA/IrrE family metallo-endopeptidase n=1 Tax=Methylobacterium sp. J-030 TaxID=2836627 RepID=UPI001FB8D995|nr:ImmA/IrrE family metallo-endopeptidase [Methylobacterium sp. J-030]MCJ2069709.1 ImmA/IrrE family metallo-endopeptidase [Methylobacterium sp. J-030]